MKKEATDWENIFEMYICDKGLYTHTHTLKTQQ